MGVKLLSHIKGGTYAEDYFVESAAHALNVLFPHYEFCSTPRHHKCHHQEVFVVIITLSNGPLYDEGMSWAHLYTGTQSIIPQTNHLQALSSQLQGHPDEGTRGAPKQFQNC